MTDIEKKAQKAKEAAEIAKKIKSAEGKLKQYEGYMVTAANEGRDTTRYANDVKYAAEHLKSLQKDLDRLT